MKKSIVRISPLHSMHLGYPQNIKFLLALRLERLFLSTCQNLTSFPFAPKERTSLKLQIDCVQLAQNKILKHRGSLVNCDICRA